MAHDCMSIQVNGWPVFLSMTEQGEMLVCGTDLLAAIGMATPAVTQALRWPVVRQRYAGTTDDGSVSFDPADAITAYALSDISMALETCLAGATDAGEETRLYQEFDWEGLAAKIHRARRIILRRHIHLLGEEIAHIQELVVQHSHGRKRALDDDDDADNGPRTTPAKRPRTDYQ